MWVRHMNIQLTCVPHREQRLPGITHTTWPLAAHVGHFLPGTGVSLIANISIPNNVIPQTDSNTCNGKNYKVIPPNVA